MFSWITGPRITNAIENIQADAGYETTFIEAPETPAHQFAVKAFKHALFGTPAPEEAITASKLLQKKRSPEALHTKAPIITTSRDATPPASPTKQPGGILRTPVTASKGNKRVSFGTQVVDNEGKRGNTGRSGIPNDCPGKFPSPWTSGTNSKADAGSDRKSRTKLTAALLDARTTSQPKSGQKPKARDDSDITLDIGAPRSESGKYWKEQYESYAERSEREVKKLVAKQQLAKNYAKKKDGEVTELITKLERECKRHGRREHDLEQQSKEYQERMRQAMVENSSAAIDIMALKLRIATLEQSIVAPSPEVRDPNPPFRIHEDTSKDSVDPKSVGSKLETLYVVEKAHRSPTGKENSPSESRRTRRQMLTDTSLQRPVSGNAASKLGVEADHLYMILAKPPYVPRAEGSAAKPILASSSSDLYPESSSGDGKSERDRERFLPKSPAAIGASSPLPQPSPDPWMMDPNESEFAPVNKMALSIASGTSHSRPSRHVKPSRHGALKSVAHTLRTDRPTSHCHTETIAIEDKKGNAALASSWTTKPSSSLDTDVLCAQPSPDDFAELAPKEDQDHVAAASVQSPVNPRYAVVETKSHHAACSRHMPRDRGQLPPVDRKERAKRRLLEKKQRKSLAS